MLPGCW